MSPITVVIADEEKGRRAACLRLLQPLKDIQVVGEARGGQDAIAAARLKPHVLLLGFRPSPGDGTVLLAVIRRNSPHTKVILLTNEHVSDRRILDALAHGAPGYLERGRLRPFLAKAVRVVNAGEAWVPRRMVSKLLERLRSPMRSSDRSSC